MRRRDAGSAAVGDGTDHGGHADRRRDVQGEGSPCHHTKRAHCRQQAGPFIVLSGLAAGHEATGAGVGATVLVGDSSPPMSRRNGGYVSVISDE